MAEPDADRAELADGLLDRHDAMTRRPTTMGIWLRCVLIALVVCAPVAWAQTQPDLTTEPLGKEDKQEKAGKHSDLTTETPTQDAQLTQLTHALVRLPIAAAFASVLALRPRRRGMPKRQAPVIQTQI